MFANVIHGIPVQKSFRNKQKIAINIPRQTISKCQGNDYYQYTLFQQKSTIESDK